MSDEERPESRNELLCFLNPDRLCGADCMAFVAPPQGKDYEGQQWAECKLLVAAHQLSKHVTVMANIASQDSSERRRTNQPPPPKVT